MCPDPDFSYVSTVLVLAHHNAFKMHYDKLWFAKECLAHLLLVLGNHNAFNMHSNALWFPALMMAIRKNHNAFKCIMLPIMAPKRITAHICFIFIFTHKKFACLFATCCVCLFMCGSSLIKILLASLQLACAYS